MSNAQFRAILARLGLTDDQLSAALGLRGDGPHLRRRIAAGVESVPGPIGLALQAFADGWRPPHLRAPQALACIA